MIRLYAPLLAVKRVCLRRVYAQRDDVLSVRKPNTELLTFYMAGHLTLDFCYFICPETQH